MPDVIDFLERMGQDAALRHAPEAELERAMRDAQMSPRARAALMSGSRAAIEAIVGAQGNVCCVVHAPLPEREDESEVTRPEKSVHRIGNVCCLIYAPEGEDQEPGEDAQRRAA